MKKFLLDLTLVENRQLNYQYVLLILTCKEKLPTVLPGQFAEIRVDGSPETFLRRPLSVSFIDKSRNELWLLIQTIGPGTKKLAQLKSGDIVNLIIPLGNSFTAPESNSAQIALVGGGVGVAPMLIWGEWLHKKGYQCDFLIGARSANDLLLLDEFEKYGKVYTTTEDGSAGEKGYIAQHSQFTSPQYDYIYTCGPTPMMQAVARYAIENDIFCEASLENTMACGFGACLCCVTATTEGNLCVCTEGPVFNVKRLKWQI